MPQDDTEKLRLGALKFVERGLGGLLRSGNLSPDLAPHIKTYYDVAHAAVKLEEKRSAANTGPTPRIISAEEDQAVYEELLKEAPPGTVGVEGSIVNDLGLAISCYFVPGDRVGELAGMILDDRYMFLVAHDPAHATDASDFDKFKRRIAGVAGVELTGTDGPPPFVFHELRVLKNRVASFAGELVRSPGNSEWGSSYDMIRRVFGKDLERIAGR